MSRGFFGARDPFSHLFREMDRMLSTLRDMTDWPGPAWVERGRPPVNIWEDSEAYFVELEVPGLKADQVELSVAGNELSIKLHWPEPKEEGVTYHRRERRAGDFSRVVQLPGEVQADAVQAELQYGVLKIRVPKAAAAKPRKIVVAAK